MMRETRAVFAILFTLAVIFSAETAAVAQAPYPNRPIRFIVPYPPGAGTDTGRLKVNGFVVCRPVQRRTFAEFNTFSLRLSSPTEAK